MRRNARFGAVVSIALACGTLTLGIAPGVSAAPPTRDPAQWPFAGTSPWNVPLGSGAQFESSTAACTRDLIDPAVAVDVNAAQWSHPVYVAAATDPLVKIRVNSRTVATIRVPTGAQPSQPPISAGGDAHLHIIDPTKRVVDEMWMATRVSSTRITAASYTRNDLYGSGIGAGGERAYGGSAIGGLIRTGELQAGTIPHALAFALPRAKQKAGPVWPAHLEDNGSVGTYLGNVRMGTLVGIPPTVDVTKLGLSAKGLVIARALQNYGGYDVDSSSDFSLYGEPASAPLYGGSIWNDLAKIRAQLRCVTNNGPSNVGGGGVPRAPLAPPLP